MSFPAIIQSGQVFSGLIGNAAIVSGSVASGALAVIAGTSVTVTVNSANSFTVGVASGGIGQNQLASGAVNSGHVGSTAINNINIAFNAIQSGQIAAGTVASGHLSSGLVSTLGGGAAQLTTYTGLTTDSYVQVFSIANSNGVFLGWIYKNTSGANNMQMIQSSVDLFGEARSGSVVLAPGVKDSYQSFTGGNIVGVGQLTPSKEVTVAIKSQNNGSPTGYEIRLARIG